ncbi:MAG TPA: nucleoside triphosphate pyrophosphohydrolase [Aquimonas sp.]|nr:nucleoside triphosphate pyrophosphohydrolase [Aquimonas sp.]HRF53555.1 nucleoside triphosphate pyrophosphohydrolase [Aquimonas sp.]
MTKAEALQRVLAQPAGLPRLLAIMAQLRNPYGGCPWDLEQTFSTIAPCTIEEAYEVADAIIRGDFDDLRDELGDLLLQVVFHARMAEEAGRFDFAAVVDAITDKLIRRHPHVFEDREASDADGALVQWESRKREEREAKGDPDRSALAGITQGLPEWQRAHKLQKRAASVGFDWPDVAPVIAKLHEELDEVRAEWKNGLGTDALEDEIGDVLFVAVNLARHAKVDAGSALRRANRKFERRFRAMEALAAAQGRVFSELDLAAQESLWEQVKRAERQEVSA